MGGSTTGGRVVASVASQLPQQPATLQAQQAAGTIQTVKIAGQTQVNLAGIPRPMATTTLTSQQLQQLANSRGQLFSSALQSALRGVAVNAQGQRTTTQLIASMGEHSPKIGGCEPKMPEHLVFKRQENY